MENEITSKLNISHLSKEKQSEIIEKLEKMITVKLAGEMLKRLSEENKEEYSELLEQVLNKNNPKKMRHFISERIGNYEGLLRNISREVISEFEKKKIKFGLLSKFKKEMKGEILDIGCGIDPFKGMEVLDNDSIKKAVAIDPSRVAIQYLRKHKKHPKIDYLSIKACDLPGLGEKFDYIFCFCSLEHFEDLFDNLQGIKSVLKKKGKVLFGEVIVEKLKNEDEENRELRRKKIKKNGKEIKKITNSILERAPELLEKEALQIAIYYSKEGFEFNSDKEIKNKINEAGFKLIEESDVIDGLWTGVFGLKL